MRIQSSPICRLFSIPLCSLLLWSVISSCNDEVVTGNHAPVIGLIGYQLEKTTSGQDSLLILHFSYEDADGDIGLGRSDTMPPYHAGSPYQYNLLLDVYDMSGTIPVLLVHQGSNEVVNFNQRIPVLTPEGKHKQIRGDMKVRLDASELVLYPNRILCDLRIYDRALHVSNTISTGPIDLIH